MRVAFFLLCVSFLANCQNQEGASLNQHQADYKNVVKAFYAVLFKKQTTNRDLSLVYWDASLDSGMLEKIKPHLNEITGGLTQDEIFRIIEKAEITDEGLEFGLYVEVCLSEEQRIYFELGSKDLPTLVQYIWLRDGTLLGSRVRNEYPEQKLRLVGTINDKLGYVDIREMPSMKSNVKGRVLTNEYFYYTPNSRNEWWQVSKRDDTKSIIGYVHRRQVLKYSAMPSELKMEIRKVRRN